MPTSQIECPKCGNIIDVQEILSTQIERELEQKYSASQAEEKLKLEKEKEILERNVQIFEEKKRRENEIFKENLERGIFEERKKIEIQIKTKFEDQKKMEFDTLNKELEELTQKNIENNRAKAEVEKLKRDLAQQKEILELESQRRINETLTIEKERIRKEEEARNELIIREKDKQLADQKALTDEMKRKMDQGSVQLQGEIQELAIEEWLKAKFPYDEIEEIKKGARGGDCIQIVHTNYKRNCGRIYYESKRTKDFQSSWIEKFKNDMREKGVSLGVIVTEVLPSGWEYYGQKEGIWICTFQEFKGLSFVLRESVIQLNGVLSAQENKGDKMHMLYDFLISDTFRMQIEAICDAFNSMTMGLDKEKRQFMANWKEREKQIEKVMTNTIEMYGSIKGIAGNSIQPVKALEIGE